MKLFPSLNIQKRADGRGEFSDYWFTSLFSKMGTNSGVPINEQTALDISAYWACINIISQDIAVTPFIYYERLKPRGKEKAITKDLFRLLRYQPNPEMSAIEFKQAIQAHALSWGNGYAQIIRNIDGSVNSLWLLRPDRMKSGRDPETKALIYIYSKEDGSKPVLASHDVFHIHGLGFDGITGYSYAQKARNALGLAAATEQYGSKFFANGARPDFVLTHPNVLGEEGAKNIKTSWNQRHKGVGNSHKLEILEEGMKIEKLSMPNDDSQFLETRKFQIPEIARYYRIPLHKIEDLERSTNNNIEQQNLEYVTDTLMFWFGVWEQETFTKLLSSREQKKFFAEFLAINLLRGDSKARGEYYRTRFNIGSLSPNDVRELENENPIEGGDQYFVNQTMFPLEGMAAKAQNEIDKQNGTDSDDSDNIGDDIDDIDSQDDELEPDENEQKSLETGQKLAKIDENREFLREKVTTSFYPLFRDAISHTAKHEGQKLRRLANKVKSQDDVLIFMDSVKQLYNTDILNFVLLRIDPIFESVDSLLDINIYSNVDIYAKNYIDTSVNSLRTIISDTGFANLKSKIDSVTREWEEDKPDFIANTFMDLLNDKIKNIEQEDE